MRIASRPEDFVVDEIPLYAPCGEGGHTFVRVEKRALTTEQVARWLADVAGVRPADVGYAGRKDRAAVARQWLSVPGLPPGRARAVEREGLRVLEAVPHLHKLRTGQLRGNRFALVVRDLRPEQVAGAPDRLACLVRDGLPNRFGAQRFGDGSALRRGRELLGGASVPRDRRSARFWLSAVQAEVFNAVLQQRPLPLGSLEEGDVAFLHASGACFLVEDPARETERAAAFELSPSGPIFGTRVLWPRGVPGERERAVLRALGIPEPEALRPPRGLRLRGARRPLRVRPEQAACEPIDAQTLRIQFELPAGSYATVLVESLFADGPSSRPCEASLG